MGIKMAEYLPLQKLFYRDKNSQRDAAIQAEAKKRLESESSFRTGIEIESGELFLATPRQLSIVSERLLRVERKVSQLWRDLPDIAQWAYLRGLIMDEIVSTNEIEGIHSTRRQIEEALENAAASKQSSSGSKRFREFARLYLELTDKSRVYPQTPNDIRTIYDAVVAGELEQDKLPDGELFRKETVAIVDSGHRVVHSGVVPEAKIVRMLEQMIALVASTDIPPLFSAIISHYLFEYIHPFYDGNGRTGRYLLALFLSEPLSLATVLSLSKMIAENKRKYYKAFSAAEHRLNYAEMTFFVMQIMEFIRSAQDYLMADLEFKEALLNRAHDSLDNFQAEPYSLSDKEAEVMLQALQYELFDIFSEISLADIARNSSVGMQTARKYTLKLTEKGLLETVSFKPLKFKLTNQARDVFGFTYA
jgi:Fic family protein